MKKVVLTLVALFLSTSYGYAQIANIAGAVKSAAKTSAEETVAAAKADAKAKAEDKKVDYEALYSQNEEVRAINKKIYEARKAGKDVKDLLAQKQEAIKRIQSEGK